MNELAATDVHADVGDARVEEDEVTRLQVGCRHWATCRVLSGCGSRQTDAGLAPRGHHETGAVIPGRSSSAPDVGLAELGHRETESGLSTGRDTFRRSGDRDLITLRVLSGLGS